jgi:uncharacterized damage-inducible protein DinB
MSTHSKKEIRGSAPRVLAIVVTLVATSVVLTACAQNSAPPPPTVAASTAAATGPDLMTSLARDVDDVQKKLIDLANAMPEATMAWRPMPGVRSVREVMLHVAGENYLIPGFMGMAPPTSTGIVQSDLKTVDAYEKQDIKKAAAIADLQASFDNLKKAMAADSAVHMGDKIDFFGSQLTRQQAWIGTVTHLHEHLGQAIAYARSNKVVPPWSK